MVFLYFFHYLDLPTRQEDICLLNFRTAISTLNMRNMIQFFFKMTKVVVRMINLSLVFTESQHLLKFSPIMKASFQYTKKEDFYTHYNIKVSAFVLILKHFIQKLIISRLSLGKIKIKTILNSKSVNIFCNFYNLLHFACKSMKIDTKKVIAIQEYVFCCNYSSLYEKFSILTTKK